MTVSSGVRRVALLMLASLAASPVCAVAGPAGASQSEPALIPAPASMQRHEGSFLVDPATRIMALDPQARAAAERFAGFIAKSHGLKLQVREAEGANKGAIHFRIDPKAVGTAPESYTLDIDPQRAIVSARDPRGLFYGAVTLWQLLPPGDARALEVPVVRIDDTPRFAWRGLMLDSARHFQTIDEIRRLLDAMALH